MAETKNKNIIDRIWDLLTSVKMAIVVFSLIGLTSIVGTVLEQNGDPQKNIQIVSKFVGESFAPAVYGALDAMGFTDMYHTAWFTGLLLVFAANLLVCSVDRFPPVWRLIKEPLKPLKPESFRSFPIKRDIRLKGKPEDIKDSVEKALRSAGFRKPNVQKEEKGWQFYAQKGRFGRTGVYMTHISIIIIMLGALVGFFFGFSGMLNLPEGSTYSMAFKRVSLTREEASERNFIIDTVLEAEGDVASSAASLGVSEGDLRARMKHLGIEPLGFGVTCEDFDVEFYGASDMPKEYTSLLNVTEGQNEVMSKWIEVNAPLKYRGYTFYQSSYGMLGNPSSYTYIVKATSGSGASETLRVRLGEKFRIRGTEMIASVTDFSPALSFDQSGRPFTYAEMMNNPAIKISIEEGGGVNSRWVLKRFPSTWGVSGSHTLEFVDVWGAQYTGLQVRKDPGVWVVYLGCLLMSVGLYIAFFVSHRKVWVMVSGEKGSASVAVAATAHKGRESFEQKIDRMLSLLEGGGK